MSDTFDHACAAFDSYNFDVHQDMPCPNLTKYDFYHEYPPKPNYYKTKVELLHETEKAYLFRKKKGCFWIPKALCFKFNRNKGTVKIYNNARWTYIPMEKLVNYLKKQRVK